MSFTFNKFFRINLIVTKNLIITKQFLKDIKEIYDDDDDFTIVYLYTNVTYFIVSLCYRMLAGNLFIILY